MRLEFHPVVQRDLSDALDYYEKEDGPNLSERFEKEFQACLSAVTLRVGAVKVRSFFFCVPCAFSRLFFLGLRFAPT